MIWLKNSFVKLIYVISSFKITPNNCDYDFYKFYDYCLFITTRFELFLLFLKYPAFWNNKLKSWY